ncbi:MAG: hypothetical protein EPN88_03440 [Bacteroidetes bacterium]|nr:MAG: hypothetical protein EPN88_03440 [Bacteroidota bacterium]
MKKLLLFSALLLMEISCSKENFDKKEDQTSKGVAELKSAIKTPNLDSIARMNAGAFLESILTAREIDSLSKMRTTESSKSSASIASEGPEYTDWSGLIHLKYWYETTAEGHTPSLSVSVGADYVLVGGGAYTSNINCFITKSMPDAMLTAWIAKSKDHITSILHTLTVFAIGMKIDGVTPDYLRSKMQRFFAVSDKINHPTAAYTVPGNYLLVGGGAWDYYEDDGGYGNMLVSSHPSSSTWYVEGKDHRRADPSKIYAYAIGIENISFPNVGYIQVGYTAEYASTNGGVCFAEASMPTGWALTCCGGWVHYNTYGRMITIMNPNSNALSVFLVSSDHTYQDSGWQYAFALRVQKAQ